jgi:curved DNA-binding protein CbpA
MYKYFSNIHTLDELKATYRRLVMQHHPDRGGDTETMKAINAEHDQLFEELKKQHNKTADQYHQTTETAEEFRDILNELLKLDGLVVELCGCWLWISGSTAEHKETLKAAGCKWAPKKKMWSWHHEEDDCHRYKGKSTMSEIRTKYGSQVFTAAGETTGYTRIGATA